MKIPPAWWLVALALALGLTGVARWAMWRHSHTRPSVDSPAPHVDTPTLQKSIAIDFTITNAARAHEWQMSQPAKHHADIVIDFEGQKVEMTFPQFKAAVFNRACWDAHQE